MLDATIAIVTIGVTVMIIIGGVYVFKLVRKAKKKKQRKTGEETRLMKKNKT